MTLALSTPHPAALNFPNGEQLLHRITAGLFPIQHGTQLLPTKRHIMSAVLQSRENRLPNAILGEQSLIEWHEWKPLGAWHAE